ncbi:hypothetical protein [Desnuesiella massiliensis]|uniref:hypothetical protein n=1 Tax=Desnuesiella massiliensis TaxID=1650662 RepID=UPI0006E27C2D|nr:hypothetical protein [Desnuesiella massiliensis]
MKNLALILYIVGLFTMLVSIIIMAIRSSKKLKLINIPTLIVSLLSLTMLVSGAVINFTEKKPSVSTQSQNVSNADSLKKQETVKIDKKELLKNIDTSIEIKGISISNSKNIFITISNNSAMDFRGDLKVNIKNYKNEIIENISVPIDAIPPKGQFTSISQTNILAKDFDYSLDGDFTESKTKVSENNYEINSIQVGKSFYTFNIVLKDIKDKAIFSSISKEIKSIYTNNTCDGFFIFFYNENSKDTAAHYTYGNAYAEYYCSYTNNISLLTMYKDSEIVKIP